MNKAATTRRIRRRAKQWRQWGRPVPGTLVDGFAAVFRNRNFVNPDALYQSLDEAICEARKNVRYALRSRLREGRHVAPFWREQVIQWIGNLRAEPQARRAAEIVCAEMKAKNDA